MVCKSLTPWVDKLILLELWTDQAALDAHAQLNATRPSQPSFTDLRADGIRPREDYVYNCTRWPCMVVSAAVPRVTSRPMLRPQPTSADREHARHGVTAHETGRRRFPLHVDVSLGTLAMREAQMP